MEKHIPSIICLGVIGCTKCKSIRFDLIILLYVKPAVLKVNNAKNINNIVPYPSLEPSGNNSGLSITNFIRRIQANENIKPMKKMKNVPAILFFNP